MVAMVTMNIEIKNLWTHFMCAFCYDEQPLKIPEQSKEIVSEINLLQLTTFQFCEKRP